MFNLFLKNRKKLEGKINQKSCIYLFSNVILIPMIYCVTLNYWMTLYIILIILHDIN